MERDAQRTRDIEARAAARAADEGARAVEQMRKAENRSFWFTLMTGRVPLLHHSRSRAMERELSETGRVTGAAKELGPSDWFEAEDANGPRATPVLSRDDAKRIIGDAMQDAYRRHPALFGDAWGENMKQGRSRQAGESPDRQREPPSEPPLHPALARHGAAPTVSAEQQEVLRQRQEATDREERAYKLVFDKYIEARRKCGQSTDLSFDAVREALHKQVRLIKSTYKTESVKFRIVVEDGKAKVKAVPQ